MTTRQWKRIRRFAIAYTICSVGLLIMILIGRNPENNLPIFGVFSVIAVIDWIRVAENNPSKRKNSYSSAAGKNSAPAKPAASFEQTKTPEQKEQERQQRERREQECLEKQRKEQEALAQFKTQEDYRNAKDANNQARREKWLANSQEITLYCYDPANKTGLKWLFAGKVAEGVPLKEFRSNQDAATFHQKDGVWHIQTLGDVQLHINGEWQREISGSRNRVEIYSRLYGDQIPVFPADCFTVTKGYYSYTFFLGTDTISPRY